MILPAVAAIQRRETALLLATPFGWPTPVGACAGMPACNGVTLLGCIVGGIAHRQTADQSMLALPACMAVRTEE